MKRVNLKNISGSVVDSSGYTHPKSYLNNFLKYKSRLSETFSVWCRSCWKSFCSMHYVAGQGFKVYWENVWAKLAVCAQWYNFLKVSWEALIYTSFWSCLWNIIYCCHYAVTPSPCLSSSLCLHNIGSDPITLNGKTPIWCRYTIR